ncbi:hypothetical protein EVB94_341 [Rhizobium phage RHph_TM40]|nr:hypothetical protein EVB94_341 [Rhizobium phage RHph_TM40]QIG72515.1 hypothetical protein EVB96_339 [Rhizobium phage RHph_TM3_3_6]
MKYVYAMIPVILLSSCVSTSKSRTPLPPPVKVIEKVVVQDWPEPPKNVRPKLPITSLSTEDFDTSSPSVAKAALMSIEILSNYAGRLETQLDAYRHKKKK